MRTEKEMMDLILTTAAQDERIRAVIMNGSRANPNVKKDFFQDYDIVYVVKAIESFTSDHSWVDRLGDRMIMQMPEDIILVPAEEDGCFPYLMQFTDGNRIDLTLVPIEKADELVGRDSLSILLLDKDKIFAPFPPASDEDYLIGQPTAKLFSDCCNEFWWCSANVAKGLWREELPYAKAMLEGPVRSMLNSMLEWHIGIAANFTVSAGKFGKYFEQHLEDQIWNEFVNTYSDADYENIWQSLFAMCGLFRHVAVNIADHYGYEYPHVDDERVTAHLHHVKSLPKDAAEMH